MRKSRKRSKRRVSRRRVSKRRVSRRRVSQGFRYSMDEEPLIDMCPVCLEKRELIPLGCGGGRHGVCNKCIVRTMRADTRCPFCRNPGGGDPWGHGGGGGGGGGAPEETASFADLDRRFQEIMRRSIGTGAVHEEEVANWAAMEEAAISARLSMMHRRQEQLRNPEFMRRSSAPRARDPRSPRSPPRG